VPDKHEYSTEETGAGWLRTEIGGYSVVLDGQEIWTSEVFDGLFYAD